MRRQQSKRFRFREWDYNDGLGGPPDMKVKQRIQELRQSSVQHRATERGVYKFEGEKM